MATASFEDVRRLTDRELRELLDRGAPEERLWAVWALALRSSDDDHGLDAITQHVEASAGVRRNLAVVLAGHGQYDLLVALATRDPAAEVRASALQLIARIALDGKLPSALISDRLPGESPAAKHAVLAIVFADAPEWLADLAERLLSDRDADVRYDAFEALLRVGRDAAALMWLEEAPEGEARIALSRWTSHDRLQSVARTLATSSRRLRRLLIEVAHVRTWSDVEPALANEPVLVLALLGRAPHIDPDLPLALRIRVGLLEPYTGWLSSVAGRLYGVTSPDDELANVLPALIETCTRELVKIDDAELAGTLEELTAHDNEVTEEDVRNWRDYYQSIIDEAMRLLVH